MAKSIKIEDYWRQNNIENLLKDITHALAQRMPADPAAAIVQHLQKKFPKSFKTSIDTNMTSMSPVSKTMAETAQLRSTTGSPSSNANDEHNLSIGMGRRASNQSQVGGVITIPTPGSAFTDLLRQDVSHRKFLLSDQIQCLTILLDNYYGNRSTSYESKKSCSYQPFNSTDG